MEIFSRKFKIKIAVTGICFSGQKKYFPHSAATRTFHPAIVKTPVLQWIRPVFRADPGPCDAVRQWWQFPCLCLGPAG